ncbi:hypothetical protein [Microcoleus sp. bin38.metabat.b11b12b14.051]|uniref:hypothetical protein n=1 Tax=Microcoleus sp. bin38.metabat.b11b12b14.051 TaxID=2742709 RepID=UPI0025D243E2|nr:hypothetical protein [Microcoleus sp. bin38.metabat.b11b12b14.051]
MDFPDKNAREVRHKKQELRKHQQEILLAELAAEIERSVPAELISQDSTADIQTNNKLLQWRRKILGAAQFFGIIIAVIVLVRFAYWLGTALIVGGIALIAYKIFLEEE